MFDFDGDGDIEEFDEEIAEYELQLMEDEMFFEEMEGGQEQGSRREDDQGKSCSLGVLIAIGIVVFLMVIIII